jgi:2,4-dienoyl-CoA reductase-like NADH-dependent reductase (Old Yellow Enzyme family)
MVTLLDPIQIGSWNLSNRIIMAPLTRCRASEGRVPNDLMSQYYRQRASAGLIITEATSISPMGVGYPDTPGIWSEAQIEGWRKITKAVHEEGGKIVLQLWHVGRVSDPFYLSGELPIAPSAIAPEGHVSLLRPQKPFVVPRALTLEEIPGIIREYKQGAENALRAGFDGVELHGANGYLLDQFLQDGSNQRTDDYGGSIENRARLMLEAIDAAISVWGATRVGLHLNPRSDAHSMRDSEPVTTFGYVAEQASKRGLAFLCVREPYKAPQIRQEMRKRFQGIYIANDSLTRETANELLANGDADAAAFGRLFISNPDLVYRFGLSSPSFNELLSDRLHTPGPKGYVDYPALS